MARGAGKSSARHRGRDKHSHKKGKSSRSKKSGTGKTKRSGKKAKQSDESDGGRGRNHGDGTDDESSDAPESEGASGSGRGDKGNSTQALSKKEMKRARADAREARRLKRLRRARQYEKYLAGLNNVHQYYYHSMHHVDLKVREQALNRAFKGTQLSTLGEFVEEIATKRLTFVRMFLFLIFVVRMLLNPGNAVVSFLNRPERDPDVQYNFSQLLLIYIEFSLLSLLLVVNIYWGAMAWWRHRRARKGRKDEDVLSAAHAFRHVMRWMALLASWSLLRYIPSTAQLKRWLTVARQVVSSAKLKRMLSLRNKPGCCTRCFANMRFCAILLFYAFLIIVLVVLGVFAIFIKLTQIAFILQTDVWDWDAAQIISFIAFINNVASITDVAAVERDAALKLVLRAIFEGHSSQTDLSEWAKLTFEYVVMDRVINERGFLIGVITYSQLSLKNISDAMFDPRKDNYLQALHTQLRDEADAYSSSYHWAVDSEWSYDHDQINLSEISVDERELLKTHAAPSSDDDDHTLVSMDDEDDYESSAGEYYGSGGDDDDEYECHSGDDDEYECSSD